MTAIVSQPEPIILGNAVRNRLRAAIEDGRLYAPRGYQANRLASESRFNLDLWSRQSGKSYINAQDAVHLAAETGKPVMCLSASQDLTKELMLKVAVYAEVVTGVAGEIQRELMGGGLDELMYVDDDKVQITQTIITLPNGERIIGRPSNPRTARGFSAHVKLDEFGMHKDEDEIWAAAFPSITSDPSLRMDVMSTPGIRADDKFADLCTAAIQGESDFAFRKVTIYDAIADGLNADAEELRRNLRDEDRWRREYLCEFVDEAGAFLTYELIRACEHEGIRCTLPPDPKTWDEETLGWNPDDGTLYLGVDIGRRHDLTVFWLLQEVGDVMWTRALIKMYRAPFSEQKAFGNAIIEHLPIRRMCVDETGMGLNICEDWQRRFGKYRVEGLTYTNKLKAELAENGRPYFQDRNIRIPIDVSIRESLHSVRKTSTAAGNVRYEGERTSDGHADEFWALMNALHGRSKRSQPGAILV